MGVKPGYRQTEVGVIPEDWLVKTIAEIAPLQRGFDLPTTQLKEGPYPVVYSNGILNFHKKAMVHGPGVITGRSGTLGKVHYIESDYWPHNTTLWVTRFNDNHPRYIYYLYNSIDFERFASGSGVPTLNRNDAHDFRVAIPSNRTEQTAIATALSDTDALIQSLERLIAKKRDIKQGAMQELLTGKKRLPGFEKKKGYKQTEVGVIPEDWEVIELGEILVYNQLGGNYPNGDDETEYPLIKMGNLNRGYINLEKIQYIKQGIKPYDNDLLYYGDVLFNTRNTLELVGKVAMWRNELPIAYYNSNILRFKFNEKIVSSNFFINLILNTKQALYQLKCIATGTTSVAAIYTRDLVKIQIPVPTLAEQSAIATILSDMDAEIAALDSKLAKARQIKQGMMQELLTGRIRLT